MVTVVFQQKVGVYTPYYCGVPVGIQGVPGVTVGFQQEFRVYRGSPWGELGGNLECTWCLLQYSQWEFRVYPMSLQFSSSNSECSGCQCGSDGNLGYIQCHHRFSVEI